MSKIRNFVFKLQNLSEAQKKIIFFTVMALVVLIMGLFAIILTKNNIKKIGQSLQSFNLPKIEIPQQNITLPSFNINSATSESNNEIFQSK